MSSRFDLKGVSSAAAFVLFALVDPAVSQTVSGSPDLQPLAQMIGQWETTAKCHYAPNAPIFEGKSMENVYWSKDGQFLISEKRFHAPEGWKKGLEIIAWNSDKQQFQIVEFTPGIAVGEMAMTVEGKISKAEGKRIDEGHVVRMWLISEFISPTESHFRSECQLDDGAKWMFSEGVSKKVNQMP